LAINRFECALSTLLHEEPPVIPQVLGFTNEMSRAKFIPFIKANIARISTNFESEVSGTSYGTADAGLKIYG